MIKAESKQKLNEIIKKVDNLKINLNAVERLKIAQLILVELKNTETDALYTYCLNELREKLERLYETGNY